MYYVVTRLFTGNKWGTANPVMMRDQDFGVVRLRAFGIYDFKIVEPKLFLKEVAGTDDHFRLDEFNDTMRSRIVSVFLRGARAVEGSGARRCRALWRSSAQALLPLINPQTTSKYGLEVDELRRRERLGSAGGRAGDRQALEHGGGRQPERLREVPDGAGPGEGDGGGVGGMARADGRRHGDGAADDESARRHPRRAGDSRHQGRAPRGAPQRQPELLTAGSGCATAGRRGIRRPREPRSRATLKGKQIGTQWRVTRAAVDQFLHS